METSKSSAELSDQGARLDSIRLSNMLTGRSADAERLFAQYDTNRDGHLSPPELYAGLLKWKMNLKPDMFAQFVECNFLYADRDSDGLLSLTEFTQLFKLISEARTQCFFLAEISVSSPRKIFIFII